MSQDIHVGVHFLQGCVHSTVHTATLGAWAWQRLPKLGHQWPAVTYATRYAWREYSS